MEGGAVSLLFASVGSVLEAAAGLEGKNGFGLASFETVSLPKTNGGFVADLDGVRG